MAARPRTHAGFTLIELMIGVALLAIVASLAMPAYFDSVRKSRRADAVSALTALQQAQERYRANAPAYTSDLAVLRLAATSSAGHYGLRIAAATATGYTAVATALPGGAQSKDARCTTMSITMDGGNIRYGSACATCSVSDPPSDPHRCWSRQ